MIIKNIVSSIHLAKLKQIIIKLKSKKQFKYNSRDMDAIFFLKCLISDLDRSSDS